MFPFKLRKGISIQHPLGDLDFPSKLEDSRLKELVTKLREQVITRKEVEELAEGHIRLCLSIASSYASGHPSMAHIFVSEALYGLTYAINRAPTKLIDDNLTLYISACAQRFIYAAIAKMPIFGASQTTMQRKRKLGLPLTPVKPSTIKFNATAPNDLKISEIKEVIYACVKNEFEERVVRLRELGYKDQEIADKLSTTHQKVSKAKMQVYRRFKRETDGSL